MESGIIVYKSKMKILSYMLVCLLCCVGLSAQQASDVKADENGYIVYEAYEK